MVKPELICFGNVLGLLWEANSRTSQRISEVKLSQFPWSRLPIRIGFICPAKYELSFCTTGAALLTYRAREVLKLGRTTEAHPSTNFPRTGCGCSPCPSPGHWEASERLLTENGKTFPEYGGQCEVRRYVSVGKEQTWARIWGRGSLAERPTITCVQQQHTHW